MRVRTVRDIGAVVHDARREKNLTQADLASIIGVSRDWVIRLEKGHPRLEAQLVLDAMEAVGLAVTTTIEQPQAAPERREGRAGNSAANLTAVPRSRVIVSRGDDQPAGEGPDDSDRPSRQ